MEMSLDGHAASILTSDADFTNRPAGWPVGSW